MKNALFKPLIALSMLAFFISQNHAKPLVHPTKNDDIIAVSTQNASKTPSQTILLNANDIATLKANPQRTASLINTCNTHLHYQPKPLKFLDATPHYTAEGEQSADPNAKRLQNDSLMAYRMGLCYLVTQDNKYAQVAQRILDSWANEFDHVASHQAQDDINFNLPNMIITASWVKNANDWDSRQFDTFLRQKILPLAQTDNPNNHGLWGVLMVASIGAYLADNSLLDTAQARWQAILQGAVASDGTMPRELARSDTNNYRGGKTKGIKGIAYTHYAMLPASVTAKILSDTGRDVWHSEGGKLLQQAFNRTATLTLHPETSPFFASNEGKLVGVHNGSYFPLLLRFYPNNEAKIAVEKGYIQADRFMLVTLFKQFRN